MPTRVAINGFGRIGEMVFRSFLDAPEGVEIVAINDLISLEQIAYLLRYDSVHPAPAPTIESGPGWMTVDGRRTAVFQERDPNALPWAELGVDIVIEATGVFRDREGLEKHRQAGASKVVLSSPAKGEDGVDITLCLGVNHEQYDPAAHHLVSNASCTTNALAPLARALDEAFGIEWGLMTTVHAYTGSQALVDRADKRMRRGRAAAINIVPTSTGAAAALGLVLPELAGKLDGMALRVPVPDGSVVDLTFQSQRPLGGVEGLNAAMRAASQDPSYRGVLGYTEDEIVSSDIIGRPWSSLYDASASLVIGERSAKVLAWYDNEFGYAQRLHELVVMMGGLG